MKAIPTHSAQRAKAPRRTAREYYTRRWTALKRERSSWDGLYREIAEHAAPDRERLNQSDVNRGHKRDDTILNSAPERAVEIMQAGMMAGITSPARQWFRLSTPGLQIAEGSESRAWLSVCEAAMEEVFARSNLYSALNEFYGDLPAFGTSVLFVDEDLEDVIRCYVFVVGSYCLAQDGSRRVNSLYRETSLTVAQLVERFGYESCSRRVRRAYDEDDLDSWVRVLHVVEQNRERNPVLADNQNMPWRSVWMEIEGDGDQLLRVSGYHERPFMAVRWKTKDADVYGRGPGAVALPDCKQLQFAERQKLKLIEKASDPPMKAPTSLQGRRASLIAGDLTFVDETASGTKLEPMHEVDRGAIAEVRLEIESLERRINRAFYADLFLMLLNDERSNVTAEEIRARQQEKMLQLGPVLERLNDELLDPLIDRVFGIMMRMGLLPAPPEELQGQPLKVEYVSILAQAQKLLGTTAVERLLGMVSNVAGLNPEALDKLDLDRLIDVYAEQLGVDPSLIRDLEQVQELRARRAQAQQQQQAAEAAAMAAKSVKDLAAADLEGNNALRALASTYGPQAEAAATGGGA